MNSIGFVPENPWSYPRYPRGLKAAGFEAVWTSVHGYPEEPIPDKIAAEIHPVKNPPYIIGQLKVFSGWLGVMVS